MKEVSDHMQVHINGAHIFCLSKKIMSRYSGKLRRIIKHENKKTVLKNLVIDITEFPGGTEGFEMISRFCYNNAKIQITPLNISMLHSSAVYLEMTEKFYPCNLVRQAESFLAGLCYWSWTDILVCLKSCESFFSSAESSGLLDKLISSLLAKIGQNPILDLTPSSSPSTSSPEIGLRFSLSNKATPYSTKTTKPRSPSKAWWFDDLTMLSPKIIEKVIKSMGCYGPDNNSLVLTKFLIHYLKRASGKMGGGSAYSGLADTVVHGVVVIGQSDFSCRGLFWVLRVVSGLGLSKECRVGLERLIGGVLDKATLDDILVSGQDGIGVYDVNLVLRLLRVCVKDETMSVERMKKVGRLIDKYMGEISPDHNLKVPKFLAVAESLPDCARDCFDGVYRAIDIYLESHPRLSFEESSTLCRCLNYEKLTLEACKDLAKNPRIPPRIAVQAMVSQHPKDYTIPSSSASSSPFTSQIPSSPGTLDTDKLSEYSEEKEGIKLNLERMQYRVVELEKVCMDMKHQMSKMVKNKVIRNTPHYRALPRLC